MTKRLMVAALLAIPMRPAVLVAQAKPFGIIDNSFLVEEAFNQEAGIVQHIFGFQRLTVRDWMFTFTQEWPAPGVRNQLSYTIPVQSLDGTSGMGDVLINYRLRVVRPVRATAPITETA